LSDRTLGLLLFLPVPIVLVLFTRQPLGLLPSLGLGVVLMVSHRAYARPFAIARANRRCLWCGGAASGPELPVEDPLGAVTWRACSGDHAAAAGGFLGLAQRHARALQVGILGTLVAFLLVSLAIGLNAAPGTAQDAVAFFRLGIALTVLPLSLFGTRPADPGPPRVPFPLHIQALVGSLAVIWLFRIVGAGWLVLGLLHVAQRLGLA
jgi:hypothetical protein